MAWVDWALGAWEAVTLGREALKGPEILTLDSPGLFDLPANSLSHSSPHCGDGIG